MTLRTLLAVTTLALLLAGCATVGKPWPQERVQDIEIGQTTQGEVIEMFGTPWRTGIEDGYRTWTYGRYQYRMIGASATSDLVIRFGENNRVRSYTYNTTEPHPK
ncbi:outer membrane protein assembly factor BamE domain-containing protein [Desulfurispira natronophila]|uniref:Outer membrane protein assembly factor BamE (Lipoprotein component of BamABCDE complex) n=1 Tax=Desulfurispira natronophila TaxID=682562 RepID=A0A7W8DH19_9BACT|nr:outer membrane protein assembly factor BamE [Desulfurispira natronophila]MBB5021813.1 outer membrane protein assembly factor BamE (lipoprotein component of BamABCDE complex) [Desulfurispira natronophila]